MGAGADSLPLLSDQLLSYPLCTTSNPCPAQAAPAAAKNKKTCSALSTLLLLLCRLLVLWGRKSQICFGPKTSKMMSKIPFFLDLSICLLIHPCLTKTIISNSVVPHNKTIFFAEGLKARKEKLSWTSQSYPDSCSKRSLASIQAMLTCKS